LPIHSVPPSSSRAFTIPAIGMPRFITVVSCETRSPQTNLPGVMSPVGVWLTGGSRGNGGGVAQAAASIRIPLASPILVPRRTRPLVAVTPVLRCM